ncbi:ABC transporter ATP-binding protein [Pseudobacteriovorax antillogorgiicola]|uniref:ABC-2 type transport system ATP-binding protein n=1 Tax=Pseudobacteriovorax antillogorgiicola TaxID=1513793 RepID=A0A1Y6B820_9BACT|nr:ABC transporter ATP-binding protein [Pseudobacteriovorax antillogorgiicola]TCS59346.1 ABC-2 type transport system ATP-binding protein [Pseudobacteriovorax antillogorgiicola]SME89107.1 ABC-2 type transport system ATP-binding protein [Pseudobacteriovorax antillogorgiicola]
MIEISGISKRFGEVVALKDVSFKVDKGQIIGFLGANGAGKTTTMDILCGCIGADSGHVKICDFDITENPIEAKARIGYLPDEPPIHGEMTVREFVTYVAKLRKVPVGQVPQRVDETLEKLSLTHMQSRLVANLSKGYRQRVGLAQALVHNPPILILDEPTEGLDPNQIIQIRELILSLKGDHTILFSSHILSEVQSLCDRLIIINDGEIVEQGTYEEIVKKFQGERSYELVVRQGASALCDKLQGIEGLTHVAVDPQNQSRISFHASGRDDVVDDVAAAVLEGKFGLLEISQKSASLEDVFHQLTRH